MKKTNKKGDNMVTYHLTGILYSKKNYNLEFKLNSLCKKRNIFLTTSTDFVELTIKNAELKPQFIFCDCETINLLDYMLDAILTKPYFNNVKIILIGDPTNLDNINNLSQDIFVCNNEIERLLDKLLYEVDFANSVASAYALNNNQLNNDIYKLLTSLGFSVKYTGYNYLCDCIKNVILNNGVIHSLTSEQYVYVATKFKTNVANVERNIRNAITETWKDFGNMWHTVLFAKTLEIGLKPTNREFINMCSHVISMKAKYQIKTMQ